MNIEVWQFRVFVSAALLMGIVIAFSVWVQFGLELWQDGKDGKINNTWFFAIMALTLTTTTYAEYGPGGHHLRKVPEVVIDGTLRVLAPSLHGSLESLKS